MGRPLYRQNEGTLIAQLANRVAALERRRPVSGHYEIKLFGDTENIVVGDGRFIFEIPYDLNEAKLKYVMIYVTTVSSSGLVRVQVHNLGSTQDPAGFDMLSTRVSIDAGEKSSEQAATPWEISGTEQPDPSYDEYGFPYTDNTVFYRQQIRIDVDNAGTGAKGLGIKLGFD